jgi:hypothetical protein
VDDGAGRAEQSTLLRRRQTHRVLAPDILAGKQQLAGGIEQTGGWMPPVRSNAGCRR